MSSENRKVDEGRQGSERTARAALAAAQPQDAFAVWCEAFEAATGQLPNRVRSKVDSARTSAATATALAEVAWSIVTDGAVALGALTSPSLVRHMAYNLAAIRLAPEQRSVRTSTASQALLAATVRAAGDAAAADGEVDVRVMTRLSAAMRGLEEFAAFAVEAGTAGEFASAETPLCEVTLRRHLGGLPHLELRATDMFDPAAWNDGMRKRRSYRRQDDITTRFHDHLLDLFRGNTSQYDDVDDLTFDVFGFRLIDVFVVLDECGRRLGTTNTEPAIVAIDSLAEALAADGNAARRRAAIDALMWPATWNESWRPWSMVEDARRLSVRPFLPVRSKAGDAILVAPTIARAANDVWNDRLAEGVWPLRGYDRGSEHGVRQSWKSLSQQIDHFFERQVANELVRAGLPCEDVEINLTTSADLSGGPQSTLECGEIDVLAVDRSQRLVVVLETKHPDPKLRPRDIAAVLRNTFVGRQDQPSDIERAVNKVRQVRQVLEDVLRRRSVEERGGWEVRGALVTPYGSPLMAYPSPTPVPVVFVEELGSVLRR